MDQVLYKKITLLILMKDILKMSSVQFDQDIYDELLSDVVQMHRKVMDESLLVSDRYS